MLTMMVWCLLVAPQTPHRTVAALQNELDVVHHALFNAIDLDLHLFHFALRLGRAIAQVNRLCTVCHAVLLRQGTAYHKGGFRLFYLCCLAFVCVDEDDNIGHSLTHINVTRHPQR